MRLSRFSTLSLAVLLALLATACGKREIDPDKRAKIDENHEVKSGMSAARLKLKTAVQMTAIPFLLYDGHLLGFIDTGVWGTWLIWASAVLTVWSMVYYLQKALPEIRARVK